MLICVLLVASTQLFAQKKIKLDGVAVVVGENIVLESDVEKFKEEVKQKSEGKVDLSDCEMLEQIMIQKLLAHHAVVDSVIVSDVEVESSAERNLSYFKQQIGRDRKSVV